MATPKPTPPPPYIVEITILPLSIAPLLVSQEVALLARALYSDDTTVDVTSAATWQTSDDTVVTVDASGVATAVGSGSATVSATVVDLNDQEAVGTATIFVSSAAELQVFTRTISQPADGTDFTVDIPIAMSDADYGVVCTQVAGAELLPPPAPINEGPGDRTAGTFRVVTSIPFPSGTVLQFFVARSGMQISKFTRTISQPADGTDFTVTLSPAQPNASYGVFCSMTAGGTILAPPEIPNDGDRQETQFRMITTEPGYDDGTVLEFLIVGSP
jgi:hypothetical protein